MEVGVKARIIRLLRMCGHAFVRTVHERLDHTDDQLGLVVEQNNALARTDTALLQSSIHTVNSLRQIETTLGSLTQSVTGTRGEVSRPSEAPPHIPDAHAGPMRKLPGSGRSLVSTTDTILERLSSLANIAEEELVRQVCVETDDYGFTNPETGLAGHLYSFLPNRRVIDAGAHTGDFSERLLTTGYEVYAFEPFPVVYEKLRQRHDGNKRFHSFNCALGADEKQADLHLATDRSSERVYDDATVFSSLVSHAMPDELPFTESVKVPVRTIASLIKDGTLPDNIDLLKIDTEGYDLDVIKGMGDLRCPVVVTEFWDTAIPFGRSGLRYTFETMVGEMRQRGYGWHLALYRVWGRKQTAFYANHVRATPNTWGNLVFFRDHELFREALKWCSAVLPYTYFKTVPSG